MIEKNVNYKGFTLIELMVTLVIIAVLALIAVPLFTSTTQNNRIAASSDDFNYMLNLGRSEAIKRRASVSLCAASNSSLNQCMPNATFNTSTSWPGGWVLFVDSNLSGSVVNTNTIIYTHPPDSGGLIISATSPVIRFNSIGSITAGVGNYIFSATGASTTRCKSVGVYASGASLVQNTTCP